MLQMLSTSFDVGNQFLSFSVVTPAVQQRNCFDNCFGVRLVEEEREYDMLIQIVDNHNQTYDIVFNNSVTTVTGPELDHFLTTVPSNVRVEYTDVDSLVTI